MQSAMSVASTSRNISLKLLDFICFEGQFGTPGYEFMHR